MQVNRTEVNDVPISQLQSSSLAVVSTVYSVPRKKKNSASWPMLWIRELSLHATLLQML